MRLIQVGLLIICLSGLSRHALSADATHGAHSDSEDSDFRVMLIGHFDFNTVQLPNLAFSTGTIKGLSTVHASKITEFSKGDFLTTKCTVGSREEDGKPALDELCSNKTKYKDEYAIDCGRLTNIGEDGQGRAEFIGISGKFAEKKGICNYDAKYTQTNDKVFIRVHFDCKVDS